MRIPESWLTRPTLAETSQKSQEGYALQGKSKVGARLPFAWPAGRFRQERVGNGKTPGRGGRRGKQEDSVLRGAQILLRLELEWGGVIHGIGC